VGGATEEEVYAAVGLKWIPPEMRENRGEIELAARDALPRLVTQADLRGDLQMHSTWSDGQHSIEEMLQACQALGYEYFALTDHSKALPMIGGLDAARLRAQWREIDDVAARYPNIRLLRSLEVDVLLDGSLDLEEELLAALDIVVISVHSHFRLPIEDQTRRYLRALAHPRATILGHPLARMVNRREPVNVDIDALLAAAVEHGVALELNAHPNRLDLPETHLFRARELGAKVAISTDAHRTSELQLMPYGIEQARRAWLTPDDVINTWPLPELMAFAGR
jgi:DNA polymerase (family 10)